MSTEASSRVESESEWGPWGSVPCEFHDEPIGPHDLRIQMWQWRKRLDGVVGVCSSTGQVENSADAAEISQQINHPSSTPTCGEGWYENETRGWARRGAWETASRFSGYHCLPTTSSCGAGGK